MGTRKSGRKRVGLTKNRVLKQALQIVDTDGLDALTMRRLASVLGVEAMSIYSHVKNKQDLMTGLLDLAVADFELPDDHDGDWKTWVRAWMRSAHAVFAGHRNLFPLLLASTPVGPKTLSMIDAFFARLQAADLDEEMQLRIWEVLRAYLYGTMAQESVRPADMSPMEFLACCTHLVRVIPSMKCCDFDRLFEVGLQIILAGIDAPLA
jgi:AcrR family transcriptional regulator